MCGKKFFEEKQLLFLLAFFRSSNQLTMKKVVT